MLFLAWARTWLICLTTCWGGGGRSLCAEMLKHGEEPKPAMLSPRAPQEPPVQSPRLDRDPFPSMVLPSIRLCWTWLIWRLWCQKTPSTPKKQQLERPNLSCFQLEEQRERAKASRTRRVAHTEPLLVRSPQEELSTPGALLPAPCSQILAHHLIFFNAKKTQKTKPK